MTARTALPSRIVLPLANPRTAADLVRIGAALMEHGGVLTALGIVEVPEGMPLSEGATRARQARRLLQRVLEFAPEGVELQTKVRIGRRAAEGIVQVADGRELSLAPAGQAAADTIFRRHALLEWLLIKVVGLGWAESDEEAARLQGSISPRVADRIAEMLGNPPTCPHGNPINAASARKRPRGIPLSETEPRSEVTIYRITEEAEEDVELLTYLEQSALVPGTHARVVEVSAGRDSLTIEGPRGTGTMGLRPASLIRVLPGRADPALFHQVPDRLDRGALVGVGAA